MLGTTGAPRVAVQAGEAMEVRATQDLVRVQPDKATLAVTVSIVLAVMVVGLAAAAVLGLRVPMPREPHLPTPVQVMAVLAWLLASRVQRFTTVAAAAVV